MKTTNPTTVIAVLKRESIVLWTDLSETGNAGVFSTVRDLAVRHNSDPEAMVQQNVALDGKSIVIVGDGGIEITTHKSVPGDIENAKAQVMAEDIGDLDWRFVVTALVKKPYYLVGTSIRHNAVFWCDENPVNSNGDEKSVFADARELIRSANAAEQHDTVSIGSLMDSIQKTCSDDTHSCTLTIKRPDLGNVKPKPGVVFIRVDRRERSHEDVVDNSADAAPTPMNSASIDSAKSPEIIASIRKRRGSNDAPAGKTKAFRKTSASTATEQNRHRILRALIEQSHTCDELEQMLSLPHQTASACIRWLSRFGYITFTGSSRVTRNGGHANVYGIPAGRAVVHGTHYVFNGRDNDTDELGNVVMHPEIKVPVTQHASEKLWYRAEIEGGTEREPDVRTVIRLLWRGAIVDVVPQRARIEGATRSETEYVIGFGGSICAGGHITNTEPRGTLAELVDDCLDFISDTQAANKKPEFPILEVVVTSHYPGASLRAPVRQCFVLGNEPRSENYDVLSDHAASVLGVPHPSNFLCFESADQVVKEQERLAHSVPESGWYRLHSVDGVVFGIDSAYNPDELGAHAHDGIYFGPLSFVGDADDALDIAVRSMTEAV